MNTPVINFECVHECIKLDTDVELALLHKDDVDRIYARHVKLFIRLISMYNLYLIYSFFRLKMMFVIMNWS